MFKYQYLNDESILSVSESEAVPFSKKLFDSPYIKAVLQALVWLIFFMLLMSFHYFSRPLGTARTFIPLPIFYKTGILYTLLIGLFYFNTFHAIPKLLFRRKINLFVIAILVALLAVQTINLGLTHYFKLDHRIVREVEGSMIRKQNSADFPQEASFRRPPMGERGPRIIDPFALLSAFIILGISTSLTVTRKWFKDAEMQKVLEKEHLLSELTMLKNQINPHFFFNTLNNIYSLTEISPVDAQKAIYTLSRLMRYMLYETEQSRVLLSKEIDFMHNYIALMRLRLTDAVQVEFDYPKDIGSLSVAPLIFVSFVENAFKHGVSYNEESYVKTKITVINKELVFTVKNRLLRIGKGPTIEGSGIGLVNVQRRLQLLYPGLQQLQISTENKEYSVYLTIQLA